MYPNLRLIGLLGIFSLIFMNLTGCGEKRVHVATVSGAPGEELVLDPITGNLGTQSTSGLDNASIGESGLSSQEANDGANSEQLMASSEDNQSINMVHEPSDFLSQDQSSDSSLSESKTFPESKTSPEPNALATHDAGDSENDNSAKSLAEGQEFSTQSRSSSEDQLNQSLADSTEFQQPSNTEPLDTSVSQDSLAGLEDILSGENLEPIPDTFQIAKIEPSDSLQDRLNQLSKEELAATAAGLEDVFFQFDSWTLTEEGKQALQRTLSWFEQEPDSNLIIEGHADQRGTQAYNMVLAKKRAVAVQDYLSHLGVDPTRMAVISYGKDKPFCQDSTEVCHQLNRRGHLLVPNR